MKLMSAIRSSYFRAAKADCLLGELLAVQIITEHGPDIRYEMETAQFGIVAWPKEDVERTKFGLEWMPV